MSGTVQTQQSLLNATEKAAATAGAATSQSGSASSTAAGNVSSSGELSSIAGNFNTFLTLLTTQLKNQDPSSPTDTSQFTSELATFAGVQQQVDTNTNLGQLISLTQSGQVSSDSSVVGENASFTGSQIPLQSGAGGITMQTSSAEPVAIAISNSSGTIVRTVQETSSSGNTQWQWDGKDNSGNALPDGAYGIAVQTQDASGNPIAVPFTIDGTVTGVTKAANGDVNVEFGGVNVDQSAIQTYSKPTA